MAARAIGTATLSFGLVSVPVKLYAATNAQAGVSFNLLHKTCGSRLKQQYVCVKENVVVERDEMAKGYEFAKDQYVMFTPEELEELEAKATQTVEIAEFVPQEKIDPVYYEKPYFLAPEKGGERAYELLAEAMRQTGRVAVARYAARGKQYLVMVRPVEGGLVMQTLLYGDEVRSIHEVPINHTEVREHELGLAKQLIDQISVQTFDPTKYEDEVKKRMLETIRRKVEGREVVAAPEEQRTGQIIDILEALKASLARSPAPPMPKKTVPPKMEAEEKLAKKASGAEPRRGRK